MSYTTRTAEFGRATFSAPLATATTLGYVYVEHDGGRNQICEGGKLIGKTVMATTAGVAAAAQKWLRQRRERQDPKVGAGR